MGTGRLGSPFTDKEPGTADQRVNAGLPRRKGKHPTGTCKRRQGAVANLLLGTGATGERVSGKVRPDGEQPGVWLCGRTTGTVRV